MSNTENKQIVISPKGGDMYDSFYDLLHDLHKIRTVWSAKMTGSRSHETAIVVTFNGAADTLAKIEECANLYTPKNLPPRKKKQSAVLCPN